MEEDSVEDGHNIWHEVYQPVVCTGLEEDKEKKYILRNAVWMINDMN